MWSKVHIAVHGAVHNIRRVKAEILERQTESTLFQTMMVMIVHEGRHFLVTE